MAKFHELPSLRAGRSPKPECGTSPLQHVGHPTGLSVGRVAASFGTKRSKLGGQSFGKRSSHAHGPFWSGWAAHRHQTSWASSSSGCSPPNWIISSSRFLGRVGGRIAVSGGWTDRLADPTSPAETHGPLNPGPGSGNGKGATEGRPNPAEARRRPKRRSPRVVSLIALGTDLRARARFWKRLLSTDAFRASGGPIQAWANGLWGPAPIANPIRDRRP